MLEVSPLERPFGTALTRHPFFAPSLERSEGNCSTASEASFYSETDNSHPPLSSPPTTASFSAHGIYRELDQGPSIGHEVMVPGLCNTWPSLQERHKAQKEIGIRAAPDKETNLQVSSFDEDYMEEVGDKGTSHRKTSDHGASTTKARRHHFRGFSSKSIEDYVIEASSIERRERTQVLRNGPRQISSEQHEDNHSDSSLSSVTLSAFHSNRSSQLGDRLLVPGSTSGTGPLRSSRSSSAPMSHRVMTASKRTQAVCDATLTTKFENLTDDCSSPSFSISSEGMVYIHDNISRDKDEPSHSTYQVSRFSELKTRLGTILAKNEQHEGAAPPSPRQSPLKKLLSRGTKVDRRVAGARVGARSESEAGGLIRNLSLTFVNGTVNGHGPYQDVSLRYREHRKGDNRPASNPLLKLAERTEARQEAYQHRHNLPPPLKSCSKNHTREQKLSSAPVLGKAPRCDEPVPEFRGRGDGEWVETSSTKPVYNASAAPQPTLGSSFVVPTQPRTTKPLSTCLSRQLPTLTVSPGLSSVWKTNRPGPSGSPLPSTPTNNTNSPRSYQSSAFSFAGF